jgi:hypothetical protein
MKASKPPCKFFAQTGRCREGEQCRFGHVMGVADAPPKQNPDRSTEKEKAGPLRGARNDSRSKPPRAKPPINTNADVRGGSDEGPSPAQSPSGGSRTSCKYFARTGKCRLGEQCKFAHVRSQGGGSKPRDATTELFAIAARALANTIDAAGAQPPVEPVVSTLRPSDEGRYLRCTCHDFLCPTFAAASRPCCIVAGCSAFLTLSLAMGSIESRISPSSLMRTGTRWGYLKRSAGP